MRRKIAEASRELDTCDQWLVFLYALWRLMYWQAGNIPILYRNACFTAVATVLLHWAMPDAEDRAAEGVVHIS
jgi:hypothetical protein